MTPPRMLVLACFACLLAAAAPARPARADGCAPVPPGLVAWWRLDGDALDVTGNHNGLAVAGAYGPAEVNQGFLPSGLGSLVQVPDSPALNPVKFTVDCWVEVSSLPAANPVFYWKGNVAGEDKSSPFGLGAYGTTEVPALAGQPFLTVGNGATSQEVVGPTPIPLNTFFHIAATGDGSTLSLYVNGALVASAPQTVTPAPSSHPVQIGGVPNPGAVNWLPGVIDEVEVHNVAATSAQIQAIYQAGTAGKCLATPARGASWGELRRLYR